MLRLLSRAELLFNLKGKGTCIATVFRLSIWSTNIPLGSQTVALRSGYLAATLRQSHIKSILVSQLDVFA